MEKETEQTRYRLSVISAKAEIRGHPAPWGESQPPSLLPHGADHGVAGTAGGELHRLPQLALP